MVGPVEIVIVGFDDDAEWGEIEDELKRLRENDVIRLIDLLAVRHREHGVIESLQRSDLGDDEAIAFGAAVGAMIGLGAGGEDAMIAGAVWGMRELADGHVFDEETSWAIAERIPEGTSAVIALIEHRWRIPVRDAVRRAGGIPLAAGWVREDHLLALGSLIDLELDEAEDELEEHAGEGASG